MSINCVHCCESKDKIHEYIRSMIQDIAEKENIDDNMKMTEDLEFDSIMIVELVTKVEDEYGVEFDSFAELIEAFDTVGSVIDYFLGLIVEKASFIAGGDCNE